MRGSTNNYHRGRHSSKPARIIKGVPERHIPRGCLVSVSFQSVIAYRSVMRTNHETLSLAELRSRLRPFCERHPIRRLEVFGSAASGRTRLDSDVDLLVTLDDSAQVSTAELLEMAGEVEEVVGLPVDFVLRPSLEKSHNRFARQYILSSAVCVYGS